MRQQSYPGSEITFEETLEPEDDYSLYVVSYQSEGCKIYALMTIPNGQRPHTFSALNLWPLRRWVLQLAQAGFCPTQDNSILDLAHRRSYSSPVCCIRWRML